MGCENLTKPNIAEAIQVAKEERSKRTEVILDRVVTELARLGFSDLRNVLSAGGSLLNPDEWDDDVGAQNWAILASIIETCKLNKIEPHAYLTGVLTAIAQGHMQKDIEMLLPWNFGK